MRRQVGIRASVQLPWALTKNRPSSKSLIWRAVSSGDGIFPYVPVPRANKSPAELRPRGHYSHDACLLAIGIVGAAVEAVRHAVIVAVAVEAVGNTVMIAVMAHAAIA